MRLAPIATVEYLQAALTLASNHSFSMAIAELDLPDVTAGGIDLLGHDGCARLAAAGFAAET